MTSDLLLALSFVPRLSRVGLTSRIQAGDPELAARARPFLDAARRARDLAGSQGIHWTTWGDPRFPTSLLSLGDAPSALWYRGHLDALARPAVAVVGSRAASAVAREMAARLGEDLAARGVVVVSGLARGVDSAAHRGAMAAGLTAAILGSGLDVIYPPEHTALAREIAGTGILLSEYPPGTPPRAYHFPLRNRLISGLSRAVVVIEAAEGSGSLITAACALEQGRDVMAVPGNVLSGRNRGGHALIRDGAKIVESADDILEELGMPSSDGNSSGVGTIRCKSISCTDPVFKAMEPGQAYDLDALSQASGLDSARLLPRLLDLELRQLVGRAGGGRFMRSR